MTVLRVGTYNIHDALGVDGKQDIRRIIRVLKGLRFDIMAIQEVNADLHPDRGETRDHFRALQTAFGPHIAEAPAVIEPERRYGNLILSRWPIRNVRIADLAYHTREVRNAAIAMIETPIGLVRFIATHFGLSHRERMEQVRMITTLAGEMRAAPTILAGDLNDWTPQSRAIAQLRKNMNLRETGTRRIPTFPSRFPVLALDRILVGPALKSIQNWTPGDALARTASDHRPLMAEVSLAY